MAGLFLIAFSITGQEAEMDFAKRRDFLVDTRLKAKGVTNPRVLEAVRAVPRHLFIPEFARERAYDDVPLPLGEGRFDPPPSLHARIAELVNPAPEETVLVVGAGSGYLCALFARLAAEVAVTEFSQSALNQARGVFEALKIKNIHTRLRDGYYGWEPSRLFDYIVVNGSVNHVPEPLLAVLRVGGKMVLPLGNPAGIQNLVVVTRTEEGNSLKTFGEVIFPPLKGKALDQSDKKEYPLPHAEQGDFTLAHLRPALRAR